MILAILQARMSSTRLPGKVLKPLLGRPLLAYQLERILRTKQIDHLVVATSRGEEDRPIAGLCMAMGVDCFRGSLDDVLDRFYWAAEPFQPVSVVRLTGDCPLADPAVIDRVIEVHLQEGNDYTSNVGVLTYPDGLDVEVMRFRCLAEAWKEARLPSEREHVTPFITRRPDRYRLGNVRAERDLSGLRWTVDVQEDFELVRQIYEALYPDKPDFTTDDILALMRLRPELLKLNTHFERNEGLRKTLAVDLAFLEHEC